MGSIYLKTVSYALFVRIRFAGIRRYRLAWREILIR